MYKTEIIITKEILTTDHTEHSEEFDIDTDNTHLTLVLRDMKGPSL